MWNLEQKLQHNNLREVWRGMRTITEFHQIGSIRTDSSVAKANELRLLYNRFNTVALAHPQERFCCLTPTISHSTLLSFLSLRVRTHWAE